MNVVVNWFEKPNQLLPVAEGDKVAGRFTLRGTRKGELFGVSPSNRLVTFTATGIYRFENGLLAEDWVEYDALGILNQISSGNTAAQY